MPQCSVHIVEITQILSHAFLEKISWKYSKFSQMADSKMAVLADWRVEFGNPFSQMAAIFPQIGGFYVKLMQKN